MAHDEAVRAHGVEVVGGVEERFTFFEAGGFGLEVHGVRAEARGGGGEAEPRARGIFEEGQGDRFAAKSGELFEGMTLNFLERFGLIENEGEFVRGERLEGQEIAKTISQICTRLRAREKRASSGKIVYAMGAGVPMGEISYRIAVIGEG